MFLFGYHFVLLIFDFSRAMPRLPAAIFLIAALAACSPTPPPFSAPPGSMAPELTLGGDGRAYLSWLEPQGTGHALRFAVYDDAGWSSVRTVAHGDNWLANWADFPSVTALANGTLAAHWLRRRGEVSHAYDIALSFSRDGGATWDAPMTPHDDGTETEHGFVTLVPAGPDRLQMVWLDGRNMAGHEESSAEMYSAMTLRFAEFDATGGLRVGAELDARTCSCCQTSAVNTPSGLLVAYRDRTQEEIRDIVTLHNRAGRWQEPAPVYRDGWHIDACPVNGPSLDARGQHAVVAWFSGAGDSPRVQVAFSMDAGKSFSKPVIVDGGRPLGRVDVVLVANDAALVSWVELAGDHAQVKLRRVYRDGRMDMPETLVRVDPSRLSGFPRMARRNDEVLIAWTEGDANAKQVRAMVRRAGE